MRALLIVLAAIVLAALGVGARELPTGIDAKRPYERVWANRLEDDETPLLALTDPAGWKVESQNAEVEFVLNTLHLLFGTGTCELRYRATGEGASAFLRAPSPVAVNGAFDTVTLWVYGHYLPWAKKPDDDPVEIAAVFSLSDGGEISTPLGKSDHPEWFLKRRKLSEDEARRCAKGAAFVGFRISGITNKEKRDILLTSLCAFKDARRPVKLPARPKRGFALFPESNQGHNTGEGRLPFPTTPLTVIPPVNASAPLEVKYPKKAGYWDDLAFRYEGGEWIYPAKDGGIYFAHDGGHARAGEERMKVRRSDKGVVFEGDFVIGGKVMGSGTVRFHREGQSLAVDMYVKGGNVALVKFGRWRDAKDAKLISVPYYHYCLDYELEHRPSVVMADYGGKPLFFAEAMDWTQTAGSYPLVECIGKDGSIAANGMMQYHETYGGGGMRPECVERFVYSFSRDFAEVLPTIPNPKSPYHDTLGGHVWVSHNSTIRERDRRQMKSLKRRGMKHMIVTDHEDMWRDRFESFTYRTDAAPKKGGDAAQRDYTRFMIDELGFMYGPYNNWMDFAPVNGFWNPDCVSLNRGTGQYKPSWTRTYQPKPAFMPYMNGRLAPIVQEKFRFNCAYCDVHTTFSPWGRVDYDARMPDAGSAYAPFYATGEVMLQQKKTWGGPVFSEGGIHFLWSGLTDGNYAQDGTYNLSKNPWLVDFDLLRSHPLECNYGTGGGHFWQGRANAPKDASLAQDQLLTATAAFGHLPQLSNSRDVTFQARSYFMLQALAKRYTKASAASIGYVNAAGEIEPTNEALASGAYRRNQVVVEYDDGTVVAANGNVNGEEMKASIRGKIVKLPPFGYWGKSGDGKATVFAGMRSGHRADCSAAEDYVYIGGRGEWTDFPVGATDGELLRLKGKGGEEEVFVWGGTAAELPYEAKSVVGLDGDYAETGAVEFTVKDGHTRIPSLAKDGPVSYRVRR